jgi:hypothetical protein
MNSIKSLAAALLAGMLQPVLAADHSQHHHQGAIPSMDADGKRLVSYDQKHEMDDASRAGLRRKVALYRGFTDRELDLNMNAMGPDYEWYVSDPKLKGKVGVLVLSHGVGANSDKMLKKSWEAIGRQYPTAIGFGMAMMSSAHLQSAVDDLRARGVRHIVLVDQGSTTRHNSLSRHWRYIFGLHPEASYLEVPRISAPGVKFSWAGHFDDDPLITDILYDHAIRVTKNPANAVVIVVGHGPEDMEDNVPDLGLLAAHVDRLKARKAFADVRIINLQDDAILPVRESNVRKLRGWATQATRAGREVVVVPLAAASYGVQVNIKNDLQGLKYRMAEQGLAEHPRFMEWGRAEVNRALASTGRK